MKFLAATAGNFQPRPARAHRFLRQYHLITWHSLCNVGARTGMRDRDHL